MFTRDWRSTLPIPTPDLLLAASQGLNSFPQYRRLILQSCCSSSPSKQQYPQLMVLKLSTFKLFKGLYNRANRSSRYLSVSCANTLLANPGADQYPTKVDHFESKIQCLRHQLCPDTLIRVLDDTQDLNYALRIFKWAALQRRFHHTAQTYSWIIFKLGLAGNVKEMEDFCLSLVNDKCPDGEQTFVSLVHAFVRHHRLSEAIKVVGHFSLGGYKPSVDVYDAVLGALVADERDFGDIVFVYKEMVKAGVLPSVATLNFLIEVLFRTNRVQLALDQFSRMGKKGCSPNSRTFELVIKGLIVNGRVDESVEILNQMLRLQCQPELGFYIAVMPLFCRENKLKEAFQLFGIMRAANFVLDSFICRELIRCLCLNLQVDDAVNVVEAMEESGQTTAVDSFVDVVSCYCGLQRFDEAANFLEHRCIDVCSPYNVLLQGYCRVGDFSLAKGLLEKMIRRDVLDCNSWNTVLRWICENLDTRKALEFLGKMITFGGIPDSATYSALVISKCRSNRYQDALEILYHGCNEYKILDSMSYSKLVEGLCCGGKIEEAVEICRYMSKHGCALSSTSFEMLISHECNAGKVDEAIRLRWLAIHTGIPCSGLVYAAIIHGLSKSGRGRDLLAFFAKILVEGCVLDEEMYCVLAQSMSALNLVKNSALLFNLMVDDGFLPDSETLTDVLSCSSKSGQLHTVSAAMRKLSSRSDVLDSAIFDVLINALWKEGSRMEARKLLDLMLERGRVPDPTTHELLMGCDLGDERTSRTLSGKGMGGQDNVFNILAEGLGENVS